MELTKGANVAVPAGPLTVSVTWSGLSSAVQDVDVSLFVLGPEGRVANDEGMVFYGQMASPDGAVRIEALSQNAETRIAITPSRFAPGVSRVAIAATLTAQGARPFSDVAAMAITVRAGDAQVAAFKPDTRGAAEAALILGEVYERGGAWKFRAVGQGFNGGLKPLAEHYGVTVADPAPPPAAPPSPPPAAARTVNLSKISLDKVNPTVSLEKKSGGFGEVRVNLNWHRGATEKRGFFGLGKAGGVDLDLCCLYELANGDRFGVQALGGNFGAYDQAPWIHLLGDDRTGASTEGEWLRVNGARWSEIRRVLVYAMIYEGVPNWSATDGVVTVYAPGNPEIEVRMEGASNDRICAVVMLENAGGSLKISRENQYFDSAPAMDRRYGFNLSWGAGRK